MRAIFYLRQCWSPCAMCKSMNCKSGREKEEKKDQYMFSKIVEWQTKFVPRLSFEFVTSFIHINHPDEFLIFCSFFFVCFSTFHFTVHTLRNYYGRNDPFTLYERTLFVMTMQMQSLPSQSPLINRIHVSILVYSTVSGTINSFKMVRPLDNHLSRFIAYFRRIRLILLGMIELCSMTLRFSCRFNLVSPQSAMYMFEEK